MNNNNKAKRTTHIKVAKGVYKYPASRTYVVRPTVNGKRMSVKFTNKAKAIAYYNSL